MINKWQRVHVFISSTFHDMQAERDWLVKIVFPELRERLIKYNVHLIDIDLRWGITQEQAENEDVLELCYQNIDKCRPFFIAILGERYGWVPPTLSSSVVDSNLWMKGYTDRSITELEILYAIDQTRPCQASFYFRDSKIIADIPEHIQKEIYVDTEPSQIKKLAELKERIRTSGYPLMDGYPSQWDPNQLDTGNDCYGKIVGLELFAKQVLDDLWNSINLVLDLSDASNRDIEQDELAIEAHLHQQYIDMKLNAFIERDGLLKDIQDILDKQYDNPLVITGASGIGKSTVLAQLCISQPKSKHLLAHFVGASPQSRNLRQTLRRFCVELQRLTGIELEISDSIDELAVAFRTLLSQIPSDKAVFIAIDGIDQLDGIDLVNGLAWLPSKLMPHTQFVFSCADELDFLDPLQELNVVQYRVPSLAHSEQKRIIVEIPALSAKVFDTNQIGLLLDNPATKNPLYLSVALEELRRFGSFDQLNEKIKNLPQVGNTVVGIFQRVIEQLEDDFGVELTKVVLTSIAVARKGLLEIELRDIVSDAGIEFYSILRRLRPYLTHQAGMISFQHRSFLEATELHYFSSLAHKQKCHSDLAQYFHRIPLHPVGKKSDKAVNNRKLDELPWQLTQANQFEHLVFLFQDVQFVRQLFAYDHFSFLSYWAQITDNNGTTPIQIYSKLISQVGLEDLAWLFDLLDNVGDHENGLRVLRKREHLARSENNVEELINCIPVLAQSIFWHSLNYKSPPEGFIDYEFLMKQEPMRLLKEHEKLCSQLNDMKGLQNGIGTQAQLLIWSSQFMLAIGVLEQQYNICIKHNLKRGAARSLANKGYVQNNLFQETEALDSLKEAEAICREIGDIEMLSAILDNIGMVYADGHYIYESLLYWQEELRLVQLLGSKIPQRITLNRLAQTYIYLGDNDAALQLLEVEEKICHQLRDNEALSRCLSLQKSIRSPRKVAQGRQLQTNFAPTEDRRRGIMNILKLIADKEIALTPDAEAMGNVLENVLALLDINLAIDPNTPDKFLSFSDKDYQQRLSKSLELVSDLGDALYNNEKFLEFAKSAPQYGRMLQFTGSRLLHQILPARRYSTEETYRMIFPLLRCNMLMMGFGQ